MNISSVLLLLLSLCVGWVVLLPLTRQLGASLYHLSALPTGLVAWSFVACMGAITGHGYTVVTVVLGIALYAGVGYRLSRHLLGDESGSPAPAWSYAVHAAALGAVSLAVSSIHLSVVTVDGWIHYTLFGVRLHDVGSFAVDMMADRNVLIPSLHAANRFFGGDWLNSFFPVLAVYVLAWLAYGLRRHSLASVSEPWRSGIAAAIVITLVITPVFRFQALLVHSHMISALFITATIVLLVEFSTRDATGWRACAFAAGIASAGFALARPDALAYTLVPVAIVLAQLVGTQASAASARMYFAGLAFALIPVYGTAFATLGLWNSNKQTGAVALAGLLLVFSPLAIAPALTRIPAKWRPRGGDVYRAAIASAVVLGLLVYARDPAQFDLTVTNMFHNLLIHGGYHTFGVSLVAVLTISLAFPEFRQSPTAVIPFFAVILYVALAVPVCALSYAGELSWADSFTRISFQWVAVALLYVGAFVGSAVTRLQAPE